MGQNHLANLVLAGLWATRVRKCSPGAVAPRPCPPLAVESRWRSCMEQPSGPDLDYAARVRYMCRGAAVPAPSRRQTVRSRAMGRQEVSVLVRARLQRRPKSLQLAVLSIARPSFPSRAESLMHSRGWEFPSVLAAAVTDPVSNLVEIGLADFRHIVQRILVVVLPAQDLALLYSHFPP